MNKELKVSCCLNHKTTTFSKSTTKHSTQLQKSGVQPKASSITTTFWKSTHKIYEINHKTQKSSHKQSDFLQLNLYNCKLAASNITKTLAKYNSDIVMIQGINLMPETLYLSNIENTPLTKSLSQDRFVRRLVNSSSHTHHLFIDFKQAYGSINRNLLSGVSSGCG